MRNTTLCYIEKDGKYLMLHRTKKENDLNHDKWIGVGGKFEDKESPEECVIRETFEETGLTLKKMEYRAVITFISNEWETEYMHLFVGTEFDGETRECDEGVLEWVDKDKILNLPLWEGDKIFLDLMTKTKDFFSLKLVYEGEKLVEAKLNNEKIIEV